jgi:hypothetical protein
MMRDGNNVNRSQIERRDDDCDAGDAAKRQRQLELMTTTTTMWMSMLVHRYIAIKKIAGRRMRE